MEVEKNKVKAFLKNRRLIVSVLFNVLLILLAVFVFGARYSTDDDIAMARLAYGTSFAPTSRIVFSHIWIGWLIKELFILVPGFNWLVLVYYAMLLISGSTGLFFISQTKKSVVLLWLFVVFSFYYSTYVNINFTLISSFLCFQGYILMFLSSFRKDKVAMFCGGISLTFSVMVRYESFFVISLFAFTCFVIIEINRIKNRPIKEVFCSDFMPFAVVLGVVFSIFLIDRLAYVKEPWKSYFQYNDARTEVLDHRNNLIEKNMDFFSQLELSEDMIRSIANWQFFDTEKIDDKKMEILAKYSLANNPSFSIDYVSELVGYLVQKVCKHYYYMFALISLSLFTVSNKGEEHGVIRINAVPWILLIPLFIELSIVNYFGRAIDRTLETIGYGFWLGIVLLLCCGILGFERDYRQYIVIVGIAMVIVILCEVNKGLDIRGVTKIDSANIDNEYSFLENGKIYMCDVKSIQEFGKA